jgi:hypothetical protein
MSFGLPSSPQMRFLLPFTMITLLPGFAQSDASKASHAVENRGTAQGRTVEVLYEGPLAHDQDWTIKAGPAGPDNQKFRALGGTCSMIPSDVHNVAGSGFERVTFEAERVGLGLWKMAWADTISGTATDGNNYAYYQRLEFTGPTNDGKAPQPNRATPTSDNAGFLQIVPSNVNADSLDLIDLFVLQRPGGGVVASSRVHWTWRLQIPPSRWTRLPPSSHSLFKDISSVRPVNQQDS